jgi:hypothetical protein
MIHKNKMTKACFRWGLGFKFLATNLEQIESLELDPALDLSLHLGSSNHELSIFSSLFFFFFLGFEQLIFLQNGDM